MPSLEELELAEIHGLGFQQAGNTLNQHERQAALTDVVGVEGPNPYELGHVCSDPNCDCNSAQAQEYTDNLFAELGLDEITTTSTGLEPMNYGREAIEEPHKCNDPNCECNSAQAQAYADELWSSLGLDDVGEVNKSAVDQTEVESTMRAASDERSTIELEASVDRAKIEQIVEESTMQQADNQRSEVTEQDVINVAVAVEASEAVTHAEQAATEIRNRESVGLQLEQTARQDEIIQAIKKLEDTEQKHTIESSDIGKVEKPESPDGVKQNKSVQTSPDTIVEKQKPIKKRSDISVSKKNANAKSATPKGGQKKSRAVKPMTQAIEQSTASNRAVSIDNGSDVLEGLSEADEKVQPANPELNIENVTSIEPVEYENGSGTIPEQDALTDVGVVTVAEGDGNVTNLENYRRMETDGISSYETTEIESEFSDIVKQLFETESTSESPAIVEDKISQLVTEEQADEHDVSASLVESSDRIDSTEQSSDMVISSSSREKSTPTEALQTGLEHALQSLSELQLDAVDVNTENSGEQYHAVISTLKSVIESLPTNNQIKRKLISKIESVQPAQQPALLEELLAAVMHERAQRYSPDDPSALSNATIHSIIGKLASMLAMNKQGLEAA